MYVHVYVYAWMCVYVCMGIYVHASVHTSVCVCVYACLRARVRVVVFYTTSKKEGEEGVRKRKEMHLRRKYYSWFSILNDSQ